MKQELGENGQAVSGAAVFDLKESWLLCFSHVIWVPSGPRGWHMTLFMTTSWQIMEQKPGNSRSQKRSLGGGNHGLLSTSVLDDWKGEV